MCCESHSLKESHRFFSVDVSRLMYVDDRIDHVVTPKP